MDRQYLRWIGTAAAAVLQPRAPRKEHPTQHNTAGSAERFPHQWRRFLVPVGPRTGCTAAGNLVQRMLDAEKGSDSTARDAAWLPAPRAPLRSSRMKCPPSSSGSGGHSGPTDSEADVQIRPKGYSAKDVCQGCHLAAPAPWRRQLLPGAGCRQAVVDHQCNSFLAIEVSLF